MDMACIIGVLLVLATGGFVTIVGFDRGRTFYPVVLIVIATYYCLFAVIGGTIAALWLDATVAVLFTAAAVIGFRTTLWLVVGALAAHGAMDIVHHHHIFNAGVPPWWPGFCSAFDISAAAYLAICLMLRTGQAGLVKSET
jgi:hypothetical protein